jgi:endonuclease IV
MSRYGVHVAAADIPEVTDRYNLGAVQIFTIVPQQIKIVSYDETALRRAAERGLHIWTHSSYLVSPWGSKPYNMPLCIKQLKQNVAVGGRGVIFHIPKAPAGSLVTNLKRLIDTKPAGSRVVLENKAVRPDVLATYETPAKINSLIDTLIRGGIHRRDIWLCFDTAHLYCSGVTLRTRADAEAWLGALKYPDRIAAFHLNGNSSTTFSDNHTIAFGPRDRIWGGRKPQPWKNSGAAAIHEFCVQRGADIILECNFEGERKAALALLDRLDKKT